MPSDFHVVRNERSGRVLGRYFRRADSLWSRLLGLTGSDFIPRDSGLWLSKSNSVHTFGMRAPIDIYYLDRNGIVVSIDLNAKPNRYARICFAASNVLEIGITLTRDVKVGDRLVLS